MKQNKPDWWWIMALEGGAGGGSEPSLDSPLLPLPRRHRRKSRVVWELWFLQIRGLEIWFSGWQISFGWYPNPVKLIQDVTYYMWPELRESRPGIHTTSVKESSCIFNDITGWPWWSETRFCLLQFGCYTVCPILLGHLQSGKKWYNSSCARLWNFKNKLSKT